jgi:hypothetical protein
MHEIVHNPVIASNVLLVCTLSLAADTQALYVKLVVSEVPIPMDSCLRIEWM